MKFSSCLLFLSSFLLAPVAQAQQSLFNVPSSQQTEKSRHFAQEQMNFPHEGSGASNFTYDYGLFENVEVGFNVIDLSKRTVEKGAEATDFMLNSQYFYKLSETWQVSVGVEAGASEKGKAVHYEFINIKKTWPEFLNATFITGFFNANEHYLENGSAHWHAGIEVPIIDETLHLICDYVNGDSSLSVSVLGLGYFINKQWMLSAGVQLPALHSDNEHGAVFELTYY